MRQMGLCYIRGSNCILSPPPETTWTKYKIQRKCLGGLGGKHGDRDTIAILIRFSGCSVLFETLHTVHLSSKIFLLWLV